MNKLLSAGAVLALLSMPAQADEAVRKVTFEDAIAIAMKQSPGVDTAAEKAAIAGDKASKLRRERLPTVTVHDDLHQFTKEYDIPFSLDPTMPPALFKAYSAFTNTVTVGISEPLTGQLYLNELLDARELDVDAAGLEVDKARLDAASRAAAAYVHVLAARAAADVSHKTVAQIEGELERAQKLRAADTYNDIDVLRFKSAKAAADQAAVRADAAATTAAATFVVELGLHDGDPVDVVDDLPPQAPPLAMTIAQAQDRAIASRPEIRDVHLRQEAAHHELRAAYAPYVPDIRAEAVYMHNTGYYPFQPDDSAFVGLSLNWKVWDWGAAASDISQGKHTERAMQIDSDQLADTVRLGVRTHWLESKAAFDSLAAADTQLQTAEEAYRLQKVRFDAGAATTTDVLDAETEVARARLASADARYSYLLSLIAMSREIGDLPSTGAVGAPSGH